jgi:anaerobic magnesium-protoporphyrin IX monomethyl ester cyclase
MDIEKTLMIRVGQRVNNGDAIDPPHWMLCKADYYIRTGMMPMIIDQKVENIQDDIKSIKNVELWSEGEEQSGIETVAGLYQGYPVTVVDKLDFDIISFRPRFEFVNNNLYRAVNWHTWGWGEPERYGTAFSSVGCPMKCRICNAKDYYGSNGWAEREWLEVVTDLVALAKRNVLHVKMMDELFVRKTPRFTHLVMEMARSGFEGVLNIRGSARVDSIDLRLVPYFRNAGINWICLDIESGNQGIRESTGKGTFTNKEAREVVRALKDNGVNVKGNYIFGLPGDTRSSMQETLDLAMELQTEYADFQWVDELAAAAFKAKAQHEYYSNANYLSMLQNTFGDDVAGVIKKGIDNVPCNTV